MKTIYVLCLSIILGVASLNADVEVVFENPSGFRDIDYGYHGNRQGQKIYLPEIERYILKEGKRYLLDGQSLRMTITDIDLAGEFEGWHPPPWDDVRILKGIYPPRISFSFELVAEDGTIIKSGEERLSDLNFEFRIRTNHTDDLYYDKAMIRDWLKDLNRED